MPGKGCCVITCSNYIYKTKQSEDKKKVIYHRFPKDENVRKKWICISGKEGTWNPDNACICSEHFTENDYERDLKAELLNIPNKRRLKPTSIPSKLIPTEKILSSMNTRSAKHVRKRKVEFVNQLELTPKTEIKVEKNEDEIVICDEFTKTTPNILRKRRSRPAKRARLQENSENINKTKVSDDQENETTIVKNNRDGLFLEEHHKELDEIKKKYDTLLKQNEELILKNLLLEREKKNFEEIQKEKERLENQNSMHQELVKKNDELTRTRDDLLKRNEELNTQNKHLKCLNNENKQKINQLQIELKKKTAKSDNCIEKLKETFTKNQIELLLKEKNKVPWTVEEIMQAFTIRYYSKRCYNYLRLKLNYPLPGLTTLKNWGANFVGKQGLIDEVFESLPQNLTESEKLIVLKYNVIKGSSEKDQINEKLERPYTRIQVIQAESLFGDWKRVIYVDFEKELTKKDLLNIIKSFENISFRVVAFVGDCGSQKLWAELDITLDKSYFISPYSKEKVYLFVDAPHLLRLLRNWFLDTGFTWENVKNINVEHIETLLYMNANGELGTFNLTSKHILCQGVSRRLPNLASELLSHNTAEAIKKYLPDDPQVTETADFIDLVSSWYDIFSSDKLNNEENPLKSAFGTYLNDQLEILEIFYNEVLNMRCGSRESCMIFQEGILKSINSLILLQQECQNKYEKNCIITQKLQQNTIESLFEYLNVTKSQDSNHCLEKLRLILMAKIQNIQTCRYKKRQNKKPKSNTNLVTKVPPKDLSSQIENITTSQRVILPKNTKLVQIGNQVVVTPEALELVENVQSKVENMTPIKNINEVQNLIETLKSSEGKGVRKEFVFAMVDNQYVLKENLIYDGNEKQNNVINIIENIQIAPGTSVENESKNAPKSTNEKDDNSNVLEHKNTKLTNLKISKNSNKKQISKKLQGTSKHVSFNDEDSTSVIPTILERPPSLEFVNCVSKSNIFEESDISFENQSETSQIKENKITADTQNDNPQIKSGSDVEILNDNSENLTENSVVTVKLDASATDDLSEELIAHVLQSAGINVDNMKPGEYVEVVFENDNRVRIVQNIDE